MFRGRTRWNPAKKIRDIDQIRFSSILCCVENDDKVSGVLLLIQTEAHLEMWILLIPLNGTDLNILYYTG